MNLKEWFYVIFSLIGTFLIDYFSKKWAVQLHSILNFGPVSFELYHNNGVMLGFFSNLPAILRTVSISTIGVTTFCLYIAIQYLLPIKSMRMRVGFSLLVGGILGNVADRILNGKVVDFIIFNFYKWNSPVFNMADILQWVGYGLIFYALIKEWDQLWPELDLRKKYWININFQLKYCFILMSVALGSGLIFSVFAYTYLRVILESSLYVSDDIYLKYLRPFILVTIMITLCLSALLFILGKIISHKIAGPIYAFERHLIKLLSGEGSEFKLRQKDELKHLEKLAQTIQHEFIKKGIITQTSNDKENHPKKEI